MRCDGTEEGRYLPGTWKSVDFVYIDLGGLLGAQDLRSLSFSSSLRGGEEERWQSEGVHVSLCRHWEESHGLCG
jgi:hypothetical protein